MTKDPNSNSTTSSAPGITTLLMGGFTLFISIVLFAAGIILYSFISGQYSQNARNQIDTKVNTALQLIDQTVSHTVQNHLQSTANQNKDIVAWFYSEFKAGHLTEATAKARAAEVLLSQKIGHSGYMYVIDSTGTLRVHPKQKLVGSEVLGYGFVQEQIARKNGYLEYEWQNPGENRPRPKSLYMTYFKPWDYIISASAYQADFRSLIDMHQFRADLQKLKPGVNGYLYVMDTHGNLIIHPRLEGKNLLDYKDIDGHRFAEKMIKKKNGVITYTWIPPGKKVPITREEVFRYYPAFDMIVVGGVDYDELHSPLKLLRKKFITVLAIILVLTLPIAFIVIMLLTRALRQLNVFSERIAQKDLRAISDSEQSIAAPSAKHNRRLFTPREVIKLKTACRDIGISIRSLVAKMTANGRRLSEQAEAIQDAAASSQSAASDHSAIVEEVSATIDSLQQTFQRTEKISRDVYTVSEQAVRKGREGADSMRDAQTTMQSILKGSEAARNEMSNLANLSSQIEAVVKSLEQIADNSQMLAINASIEAAEAGEAGKGFAVVATEVQELAVQSARATQDIRTFLQQMADTAGRSIRMTETNRNAIEDGQASLMRMEKVLTSLIQVLDSNSKHVDQISKTVNEQSSSISQISVAVSHALENAQAGNRSVSTLTNAVKVLNESCAEFEKLRAEYKV